MNKLIKFAGLSLSALCLNLTAFASEGDEAIISYLKKSKARVESKLDNEAHYFLLKDGPDNWKNESGVILYKYTQIQAMVVDGERITRVYTRYRVKLHDQFAVNDFSEFYFGNQDFLEIKVIKPDGREIEVDMADAVKADEVREDLLGISGLSITVDSYKKIPVSNLNQGDIIEVTQVSENIFFYSADRMVYHYNTSGLDPEINILNSSYPTYHNILEFKIEEPFRLAFRPLNGAPDIKRVKGSATSGTYVFHDSLRAPMKSEFWSKGAGFMPAIKYAIHSREGAKYTDFNTPEFSVKSEVTEEDVKEVVFYETKNNKHHSSGLYSEFVRLHGKKYKKDKEGFLRAYYYYLRTIVFHSDRSKNIGNVNFVMIMKKAAELKKIPHEILLAAPKTSGGIQNIISRDELILALRIKGSGTIYSLFTPYSNPNEVNQSFLGSEIYVVETGKKLNKTLISKESFENDKPEDHATNIAMKVQLNLDSFKLRVDRQSSYKGFAKRGYNSYTPYNIYQSDDSVWGYTASYPVPFYFLYDVDDSEFFEEESERLKESSIRNMDNGFRNKLLKDIVSEDWEVKKIDEAELVATGRSDDAPDLIIKEKFCIDNLLIKAGDNYILNVGKLIGGQFEIKDSEDLIRNQDIYFGYPRTYVHQIEISLPEGYKAVGVESLTRNISNEAGEFTYSVSQDGNKLIVKSVKTYKLIELPKDKWPQVLDFIQAATDVQQSSVVLTK